MAKYKKHEIELSPQLLKKLFELVKDSKIVTGDFIWIIDNIVELSKCDEMLTLDEYELIIRKPTVV